ncbi:MAG: transporter [Spirochaetaceae bacterium]|nr:transporter [Spirochaetaceae bacterium]
MEVSLVISKLMPVILIIALGWVLQKAKFITDEGNNFLKKLIVNVGLPAVLFVSFLNMSMTMSLVFLIPGIFILNALLLLFGKFAGSLVGGKYSPFLFTGFEYGMFAIAVFTAAYGTAATSYIAIIDLGHELFIWFVFVTFLLSVSGKKQTVKDTLSSFIKSPIILAITFGIIANVLNLEEFINSNPISKGLLTTVEMLMSLTAPLILLSIGAGLSLSKSGISFAVKVTAIRMPLVLILSYVIGKLILRNLLRLPFVYEAALFTLLIAPPPFIIPLFMPNNDAVERGVINTTLTFYTIVSLVLFVIFFAFNPVL